ncbi:MAG: hypothetical protein ABIJ27_04680 [Candidatus Omnitrophota bacterium]
MIDQNMKARRIVGIVMTFLALSALSVEYSLNAAVERDPYYEIAMRYLTDTLHESGFTGTASVKSDGYTQFAFDLKDGSSVKVKIAIDSEIVIEEEKTKVYFDPSKKSTVKDIAVLRRGEGGSTLKKAEIKEAVKDENVIGRKSRVDLYKDGELSSYSIIGENFRYKNDKMIRAYEYSARYDKDNKFLTSNSALTDFSFNDDGVIAEAIGTLSYFGSDNSLVTSKDETTKYDYWNEGGLKGVLSVIRSHDHSRFKGEEVLDKVMLRGAHHNKDGSLNRTFDASESNLYYDTLYEGARVLKTRKWIGTHNAPDGSNLATREESMSNAPDGELLEGYSLNASIYDENDKPHLLYAGIGLGGQRGRRSFLVYYTVGDDGDVVRTIVTDEIHRALPELSGAGFIHPSLVIASIREIDYESLKKGLAEEPPLQKGIQDMIEKIPARHFEFNNTLDGRIKDFIEAPILLNIAASGVAGGEAPKQISKNID